MVAAVCVYAQVAVEEVGCAEAPSRVPGAAARLFGRHPNTSAIFGVACSDDVQATLAWLAAHNKSVAVVSSEARAPHLADDTAYPNLARFTPNEQALLTALYCVQWGISRLCVRVRPVSRDGSAGAHAH